MLPLLPPCLRQFVAEVSFCLLLLGSPAAAIDGAAPSERPPPFDPRIHAGVSTCPLTVPLPLLPHAQFACPVPLTERDVLAGPARWSPWTHPPICVAVSRGKSERFCVYSNSRHGLSGFSLITTPKIAAATGDGVISERIRGNPMRPRLKPGVWESVMSKNGSKPSDIYDLDETAYVNDPETTPPYIIRRIPGKGLGVVAIRKIPQHSTIMADYASLVLNMEFPSAVRRVAGYALLHIAAEQIAEMGGEKIIRALDQSSSAAEDEIENVLRTNAFHAPLGEVDHMALYPEVSRINHACNPNAFSRFLPDSFTVTVGAARDIEPGEEVTISYLMVGQTYEKRQKALKRWEFTCKCALCSAPEAERNASDARRIEIEKKRDQVMDAFRAGDANKAIRLTEDIIRLARLEGLTPFFSEQYDNLGRIYWAIGQRQESERYARMSLRVLREQGFVPEDQDEEYQVRLLLKSYAEEV